MKLVIAKTNFKIQYSFLTSVLMHGGLLLLAVAGSNSSTVRSAEPLGQDLAYVEVLSSATEGASAARIVKPIQPVVAKNNPTDVGVSSKLTEEVQSGTPTAGVVGQGQKAGALHGVEGVANGVEGSVEARYLYELKKLLERKKVYPQMAKVMGYSGTVKVEFIINRDGAIENLRVLESAYPVLSQAAERLIRSIEGLKPFPQDLARSKLKIEVPVQYSIQ